MVNAVLRKLALALCAPLAASAVAAQAPLFAAEDPVELVISLPLDAIYRQADEAEREQMEGYLSYRDTAGTTVQLSLKVRTRGVFRREHCSRPPLRLNFRKKEVRGTLFDGQDKLKLVNPCDAYDRAEQQLALEYLAYKVYEELSDFSFRTRLLRLRLEDSSGRLDPWTTTAFILEDEGEMVERVGGTSLKAEQARRSQMDLVAVSRVELFQYLIANTDFSMYRAAPGRDCCHNIKLANMGSEESPRYVPVPYDFDSSGLVNARYARPPEFLPIDRVRQRYYMGYCRDEEFLDEAVAYFQERREAIRAVFSSDLLTDKTRRSTLKYIDRFFDILDSPKRVRRELADRCRGEPLTLKPE